MAIRLRPDSAQFYPIMACPGTRLFDEYEKHGMIRTHDFREWVTHALKS